MNRSEPLESDDSTEPATPMRRLESLDDITREIADRRLERTFQGDVPPQRLSMLAEKPSVIEERETFESAAHQVGIEDIRGLQGFATQPEDPAHVLKMDMPERIATLEHENLHRLTAPELLREAAHDPELRRLYEGVTEHLAQQASQGLHEYQPGQVYPEAVEDARQFADEVGEDRLRQWYFEHQADPEIQEAIKRLSSSG